MRAGGRHGGGLGSRRGVMMGISAQKLIGTRVIRKKRGIQWERSQIMVPWKGLGPRGKKKGVKVKGTTAIRRKRGFQWTRSQIMVRVGSTEEKKG
jgi:hypothetical protein